MVGSSSMLGLSAGAVDKEIVGRDSDAEVAGGDGALGFPVDCEAGWVG